jgi:hypothetical protein
MVGDGTDRGEILVDLKAIMAGESDDPGLESEDILFVPTSSGRSVGIHAIRTMVGIASGIAIWRVAR